MMRHLSLFVLSGSLMVLLGAPTVSAQEDQGPAAQQVLLAGAATSNITPPLGELIVGNWKPLPADSVHDELHARCLVLDNGQQRLAIVICDNVGIPQQVFDAAKKQVHKTTGIAPEFQLMSATHTHSATTARGPNALVDQPQLSDYQQFLISRITDGVRRAVKQLRPAKIGWGSAVEPREVFNRRWYVVEDKERRNPFGGVDKVRMNPGSASTLIRPAGPVDPEISFLSVQSLEGEPLALLANYSLHYVGGVPPREVSADYFAVFADEIAQRLDAERQHPPFVAMMSNGTSGDVNNINFRDRGPRRELYEKMQEVGERVADKVHEAMQDVEYQTWVPIHAAVRDLTLQVRKPSPEILEYMKGVEAKGPEDEVYQSHEATYADRIKLLVESPDAIDVPLQAVRIGELGIAAIPFEVFVEIGLEIKEKSPMEPTFTISLANGSYGYLPTPEHHKLGGYETWLSTNKVEEEASQKIVAQLLEMLTDLQSK